MPKCFNCGNAKTSKLHGYSICAKCKSKLGLFTDKTISKYKNENPKGAFKEEIERRLDFIEKDYKKRKSNFFIL